MTTPTEPFWTTDHPRSRGVYRDCYSHIHITAGSSPLARGLLSVCPSPPSPSGIIPARAGFTFPADYTDARTADHPRSRGVYHGQSQRLAFSVGSSPLARGLRWFSPGAAVAVRIIPARAGFTHDLIQCHASSPGSSPLARGLQYLIWTGSAEPGIIPARAGFTAGLRGDHRSGQDHPRSRGVYSTTTSATGTATGSSPLARGLHYSHADMMEYLGIIPARAGFTSASRSLSSPSGDHPRSRGVYCAGSHCGRWQSGSSPLARGLPIAAAAASHTARIIPARAGFTGGSVPAGEAGWDHPRSRGVYRRDTVTAHRGGGSSPLARGLHHLTADQAAGWGIIPARAGFTPAPTATAAVAADHPRSRGVYGPATQWVAGRPGSSPLARGLPAPSWGARRRPGIIPARAGFTPTLRRRRR